MKQVKIENKEYIFIEVPDDVKYNLGISVDNIVIGDSNDSANWITFSIQLPKENNYQIITTTNTITEEIFENIYPDYFLKTEDGDKLYRNFKTDGYIYDSTWKESFYSLMDSLELDRKNKNYLLIEKL